MAERELQKYDSGMKGKIVQPFKGGDDTMDYVDKSGKPWLAKKDETPEELIKRAEEK